MVKGDVPLILDSGIRRGTDVVKALAMGANAVAIGRPVMFGLALGGASGVNSVIEFLRRETINLSCTSVLVSRRGPRLTGLGSSSACSTGHPRLQFNMGI